MNNGKGTIQMKEKNNENGYRDLLLQSLSGNVGIGTTNATEKFHVFADTSDNEPLALFQATGDCGVRIEGKGGEAYLELANINASSGDTTHSWGIGMNDNKYLQFNWKNNGNMNDGGDSASGVGTGEVNAMTIKIQVMSVSELLLQKPSYIFTITLLVIAEH